MGNEWKSRLKSGGFLAIPRKLLSCDKLTSSQKLIIAYLASCLGRHRTVWPSLRVIAGQCGLWTSRVQTDIDVLKQLGLLALVPKEHKHKPSNEYQFDWLAYDKLVGIDPLEALEISLKERSIEVTSIDANGKFVLKATAESRKFLENHRALVEEMLEKTKVTDQSAGEKGAVCS